MLPISFGRFSPEDDESDDWESCDDDKHSEIVDPECAFGLFHSVDSRDIDPDQGNGVSDASSNIDWDRDDGDEDWPDFLVKPVVTELHLVVVHGARGEPDDQLTDKKEGHVDICQSAQSASDDVEHETHLHGELHAVVFDERVHVEDGDCCADEEESGGEDHGGGLAIEEFSH